MNTLPATPGTSPKSRYVKVPRTLKAVAAALLALSGPVTSAAASAPPSVPVGAIRQKAADPLRCRIHTLPGRPITFSPRLTLLPRTTEVSGSFRLSDCVSPGGPYSQLRSGAGEARGTGRASCGGASDISGTGTITWYDPSGRRVGTSTLNPTRRPASGYNPGDSLLIGEVTRGPLAGLHMAGSITPTSDVTACASSGLSFVHGTGTLRFLR